MSSTGQKMSFLDALKWSGDKLSGNPATPDPKDVKAPYSMTWIIAIVVLLLVIIALYIWYCNRAKTVQGVGQGGAAPSGPLPASSGVPSAPLPVQ